MKKIIENVKNIYSTKKAFAFTIFSLIIAALIFLESGKVVCEFLENHETCNVYWKVPYWSLFIAFFIFALWGMTTARMAKVFHNTKVFAKKRPIATIVMGAIFLGMLPFPLKCTQTVFAPPIPVVPGSNWPPLGLNDLPLQNSQCYFVLTKEYWMPKKPTLGKSIGPLLGFIIATFKSDN